MMSCAYTWIESDLTQLVDNFNITTLLVHQLVRSERECDFNLQQYTLCQLQCYLFSAGHFHYARYLTQHLEEVKGICYFSHSLCLFLFSRYGMS